MSKDQLLELVNLSIKVENYLSDAHALGVDFIETPLFDAWGAALDIAVQTNFNEYATDIFNAWLFEDIDSYTDDKGVEHQLATFDDVWQLMDSNRL